MCPQAQRFYSWHCCCPIYIAVHAWRGRSGHRSVCSPLQDTNGTAKLFPSVLVLQLKVFLYSMSFSQWLNHPFRKIRWIAAYFNLAALWANTAFFLSHVAQGLKPKEQENSSFPLSLPVWKSRFCGIQHNPWDLCCTCWILIRNIN